MLPKKNRLTFLEFNRIFQKSRQFNSNFLSIKIKEKSTNNDPRFVVVVPKKLDKRSTKRHLTKRIILEIIKNIIDDIPTYFNVLIKAQKIINRKNRQIASREIKELLNNAHI